MFHIVLIEPEIPQNTGAIGRLCLATQSTLHLVEPLGFELSDRKLKRAGLDYWKQLKVKRYPNLSSFLSSIPSQTPKVFFSTKGSFSLFDYAFTAPSYLFFGKETAGLPETLLEKNPTHTVRIPMFHAGVRSLNLATTVGIALYHAIFSCRKNQSPLAFGI